MTMTPDQRIREIEKLAAARKSSVRSCCVVVDLAAERAKRRGLQEGACKSAAKPANTCAQMFADARKSAGQRPIQGDLPPRPLLPCFPCIP